MFLKKKQTWRRRLQRVVSLFVVLALVICSLGVPLPMRVEEPVSEPYPCQNCGCGCPDAETCWRECCCYTQEEKIAWAKENSVLPPAFVLAQLSRKASAKTAKTPGSCCSSVARTCCDGSSSCCSDKANCEAAQMEELFVLAFQVLRCRGLTSSLTSLPPSILPMGKELVEFQSPLLATVVPIENLYSSPSQEIEPPPPQLLG